jgi:YfiH family protein
MPDLQHPLSASTPAATARNLTALAHPLGSAPRIQHGYFGRQGGVSGGIYTSLNVGSGSKDDPKAVTTNRARVADFFDLAPSHLVSGWQVHSPNAVTVRGPWPGERPQCDALVTQTPGLALCVLTADCAPVLFADAEAGVIGAAHAGWKGAFTGVLEATVEAMLALGAQARRIRAAIGPCISQKVYEVGPEFAERLLELDDWAAPLFVPGQRDRQMFDLRAYVEGRLRRAGLVDIDLLQDCTFLQGSEYFSHRRSVSELAPDYGRNASVICMKSGENS